MAVVVTAHVTVADSALATTVAVATLGVTMKVVVMQVATTMPVALLHVTLKQVTLATAHQTVVTSTLKVNVAMVKSTPASDTMHAHKVVLNLAAMMHVHKAVIMQLAIPLLTGK